MTLRFPSVKDVAWELRSLSALSDKATPVRFQILTDGNWWVHPGNCNGDMEGGGYCSCADVPGRNRHGKGKRFPSEEIAKNLIDEAADMYIQDKEE